MNCWLKWFGCAVWVFAMALASESHAQRVSFSFGSGGHGHGHHHHHHHGPYWHRPYWDVGWYYPPPPPRVTYIQPERTIVVPQTTVVAPAAIPTSSVASTIPSTSLASTPSVRANSLPAYRGPGITIQNQNSAGLAVVCVLDGQTEIQLRPGETRPLKEKANYVVEFDRGASFGTARYDLSEGTYQFVVTDRGWDLQRDSANWQTATNPEVKKNPLPATIR